MKIMMIGPYNKTGGVSQVITYLSRVLSKDHQVIVVSQGKSKLNYCDFTSNGKLHIYEEKMLYQKRFKEVQRLISSTVRAFLIKNEVDLFHAHGEFFSGIAFLIRSKPFVITIHGYPAQESISSGRIKANSLQDRFMKFIETKVVERADAVIAVDRKIYNWIVDDFKKDKQKVFHITNGVDINKFNPNLDGAFVKERYNIRNKKIILFLKALIPKNGPEVIITAMKQILDCHSDAVLLIAGDGYLRTELERRVQKLGIQNDVIFCGNINQEETPYFLNAADIITVPSVKVNNVEEATSLTMFEAMAVGRPVVVSNIGGLKETIDNKKYPDIGIIFEEKNHCELAQKIIHLLSNKDEIERIGKNARAYVEKEATWELNASKVLRVYEQTLEKFNMKEVGEE